MKAAAAVLAAVLAGCASGSAPVGGDSGGSSPDVFDVTGNLKTPVGVALGPGGSGITFKVKGSASATTYYWTVSGNVPSGVEKVPPEVAEVGTPDTLFEALSNTFSLQGIPTECKRAPLTITVHNVSHTTEIVPPTQVALDITGNDTECGPPSITTPESQTFFTNSNVSLPIEVTGGAQPFTWSVVNPSAIPAGLAFDTVNGVLFGSPTAAVTSSRVTIVVTDRAGRTHSKQLDIEVRAYSLEDFTGTWSGIVTKGYFQRSDLSYVEISGQRLSLLLGSPVTPQGSTNQANPIVKGTLGALILDAVPTGLKLGTSSGGFEGLLSGQIPQLQWHFTCDPDLDRADTLLCTGHHYQDPNRDAEVILTLVSQQQQDVAPPDIDSSDPAHNQTGATNFPVTVTFTEPMSGSASVQLTQGSAAVGAVTFRDLTTAVIPLDGLNSNTTYTLTLNPAGTGTDRFMDLAGNLLPQRTITFTTGLLTLSTITITKSGTGTGAVIGEVAGAQVFACTAAEATCSYQIQQGTTLTLTADPSGTSSFVQWGTACPGTSSCQVTLDADKTVTATFSLIPTYDLTVTINPTTPVLGGFVATSPIGPPPGCDLLPNPCAWNYQQGTVVVLTAVPAPGFSFTGWSGPGCSGTGTCTVTMNADRAVTAAFTALQHDLTVTTAGNGLGTVSSSPAGISCGTTCTASFDNGTIVTLTANPVAGSTFAGWSGSGGCSGTATTCAVTMNTLRSVTATFTLESRRLTIIRTGTGTGLVTSSPSGVNCGSICAPDFNDGTTITLTAAPATGSSFAGWSGDCTGTGTTCTLTLNAPKTVTATFTLNPYTLTVTKNGTGSGNITSSPTGVTCSGNTCSGTFNYNTNLTLTATPVAGSMFTGWGAPCTGTGTCTVLMDDNKSVTATFTLIPSRTLTVTKAGSGSGTVTSNPSGINCSSTCNAEFTDGTLVTLTAVSSPGSVFAGWTGDCAADPCTMTMSANRSVTATFNTQPTFPLTLTIAGSGSGSVVSSPAGINCTVSCTGNFAQGQNVTLSATPSPGSTFSGWTGAGCSGTAACSVTMSDAQGVTATFTIQSYTLSVFTNGTGTGTVTSNVGGISCSGNTGTCSASIQYGTVVTLTANPAAGSAFSGWNGACTATPCTITVTSNQSATATFTIQTFALTLNTAGNGTGSVASSPSGISCGNGNTACTANFNQGTVVTLTATAAPGSSFTAWTGASGCSSALTCSVTMSAAQSVTATFTAQNYTLIVSKGGSGTGTVTSNPAGIACGSTCSGSFPYNTVVTLTAVADAGFSLAGWTGCTATANTCTVTITGNTTVTASFATQYQLTVTVTGSGTVTSTPAGINCAANSTCSANFVDGTAVSLNRTPGAGFAFTAWSGDCTGNTTCSVTMSAARAVTATFTNSSGGNLPPTATPQSYTYAKRQLFSPLSSSQFAFTLTGTDPEGGPLTFRITRFPTFNDPARNYNVMTGSYYTFVNPVTGASVMTQATTTSLVNVTTRDVTVSPAGSPPYFLYTPYQCHVLDIPQDSFEFVAIDDQGNISAPATVNLYAADVLCSHQ
jgi:hypothetical protein